MAKKQQKEKSIEETLWESANKLRGSVEPSEYKHVVLSLIFLKYAYDRFLERRNELIADHQEVFVDQPVFYNAKNVFYLNEISRWDYPGGDWTELFRQEEGSKRDLSNLFRKLGYGLE